MRIGEEDALGSMIVWLLALGASVVALVLLAQGEQYFVHAAISALTALAIACFAARDNKEALATGSPAAQIGALNANYMATIWAWAALVMAVTYTFVLDWKEWWHFVLGFAAAALVCGGFARMLAASSGEPVREEKLLRISRYLAIGQLVGMAITMVGLVVDRKMDKIGLTMFGERGNPPMDWAGNNAFFFGALGLVIVSWVALRSYNEAASRTAP